MSGRYSNGQTMPRPGIYFREENGGGNELIGARNGVVAVAFKANWGPLGQIVTLESSSEIAENFGDAGGEDPGVFAEPVQVDPDAQFEKQQRQRGTQRHAGRDAEQDQTVLASKSNYQKAR